MADHKNWLPILLLLLLVAGSCKKKVDFAYDNRPATQAGVSLNTRLVNLIGYRELQVGEKRLTSFLRPDAEGYYGSPGTMRVTPYFPQTGQLTTVYNMPAEFLGSDGYIRNILLTTLSSRDAVNGSRTATIRDFGRSPMDYYFVRYADSYKDSMFAIPRDITTSSSPTSFKIRILNLSITPDYFKRDGRMTLTFADGTPVNNKTSHIDRGAYSDYIEMPYGTYQFKVLTDEGREVPGKSVSGSDAVPNISTVNPVTGTLMSIGEGVPGTAGFSDSWLTYAPVKTFQPGGVYTIVVSNITGYSEAVAGSNGESVGIIRNCFQLINDISEPLNISYARMQAVNTLPGNEISWSVGGKDLGTTGYTANTAYQSFLTGNHTIEARDSRGAVIASAEVSLRAGDNITAWSYTQNDGKVGITISNNNLSGSYGLPVNGNDGSYASRKDHYPFWIRFMNFCKDLPDVTFTDNNGLPLNAAANVNYGIQKTEEPYSRMTYNFSTTFLTYSSKPGVVPGNWVQSIVPLPSRSFIKNIELYKTEQKPFSEPGIYTLALVGQLGSAAPQNARMILVKHNQ